MNPDYLALLEATHLSVAELRMRGRTPSRIRIHPLDAETIIAEHDPGSASEQLTAFLGYEVLLDATCYIGEPVAEWSA